MWRCYHVCFDRTNKLSFKFESEIEEKIVLVAPLLARPVCFYRILLQEGAIVWRGGISSPPSLPVVVPGTLN